MRRTARALSPFSSAEEVANRHHARRWRFRACSTDLADHPLDDKARLRCTGIPHGRVKPPTMKRHIRVSGLPHRKLWGLTLDQIDEAKQLYVTDGWSILKLSKHLGAAEETVRNALRKDGVQLRSGGRPKADS
jgi:hypothetical protein